MRQLLLQLALLSTIALVLITGLGGSFSKPAIAAIRQLEEAPGQMLYQSRQILNDQQGNSWQAIAFKRIRANGDQTFNLRLVGFPGIVTIDRSLPLTLTNSLGQVFMASDASQKIFTDTNAPESHVGQYDLQPILSQLQPELSWQLDLPTQSSEPVTLSIGSSVIQEWQAIAQSNSN